MSSCAIPPLPTLAVGLHDWLKVTQDLLYPRLFPSSSTGKPSTPTFDPTSLEYIHYVAIGSLVVAVPCTVMLVLLALGNCCCCRTHKSCWWRNCCCSARAGTRRTCQFCVSLLHVGSLTAMAVAGLAMIKGDNELDAGVSNLERVADELQASVVNASSGAASMADNLASASSSLASLAAAGGDCPQAGAGAVAALEQMSDELKSAGDSAREMGDLIRPISDALSGFDGAAGASDGVLQRYDGYRIIVLEVLGMALLLFVLCQLFRVLVFVVACARSRANVIGNGDDEDDEEEGRVQDSFAKDCKIVRYASHVALCVVLPVLCISTVVYVALATVTFEYCDHPASALDATLTAVLPTGDAAGVATASNFLACDTTQGGPNATSWLADLDAAAAGLDEASTALDAWPAACASDPTSAFAIAKAQVKAAQVTFDSALRPLGNCTAPPYCDALEHGFCGSAGLLAGSAEMGLVLSLTLIALVSALLASTCMGCMARMARTAVQRGAAISDARAVERAARAARSVRVVKATAVDAPLLAGDFLDNEAQYGYSTAHWRTTTTSNTTGTAAHTRQRGGGGGGGGNRFRYSQAEREAQALLDQQRSGQRRVTQEGEDVGHADLDAVEQRTTTMHHSSNSGAEDDGHLPVVHLPGGDVEDPALLPPARSNNANGRIVVDGRRVAM